MSAIGQQQKSRGRDPQLENRRRRPVRIADAVHGYIALTPIERTLLDSPVAQRLHYVGQFGLAHLVFPDRRTSRFAHSLGAMHLASAFFAAALAQSEPVDRDAALLGIKAAVDAIIGDHAGVAKNIAVDLDGDCLRARHAVPRTHEKFSRDESEDFEACVQLTEQGLRLAALFHDLGHLPFSHDFEFALDQLVADGVVKDSQFSSLLEGRGEHRALHERIGQDLANLVLTSQLNKHVSVRDAEAARVTFGIAAEILAAPDAIPGGRPDETTATVTAAAGAFGWLHSLISGELDVDRCDYMLRDAYSFTLGFSRFDLQSLIENAVVVRDSRRPNLLVPATRLEGQAAVESFVLARCRIYQYCTRHHKVSQIAAALRYATREVLCPALGEHPSDPELSQFLADLGRILDHAKELSDAEVDEVLKRFGGYDDQWWMGRLRAAERTRGEDRDWFGLVCWRSPGSRALWKGILDFPLDDGDNEGRWGERMQRWNSQLPADADLARAQQFDLVVRELRDEGVLVTRHCFEPWLPTPATAHLSRPKSALSLYHRERGLVAVTDVSPAIAALRDAWAQDLQVHAFARADLTDVTPAEVLRRLTLPRTDGPAKPVRPTAATGRNTAAKRERASGNGPSGDSSPSYA